MVFVNSMSDLFHELVPVPYVAEVFSVMAQAPRHRFQILTKRPERMAEVMTSRALKRELEARSKSPLQKDNWPLPNVWLGVSIENNRWAHRADGLRRTPAAVRFISAEPLLGPLLDLDLTSIDWLIVGGESGQSHRPMDANWVRDLRDVAVDAGTAFFFKQWGGRTSKAGGRQLDGRTWDEMPVGSVDLTDRQSGAVSLAGTSPL
jgi:protein gp37